MIEMVETLDGGDYNVTNNGITLDNSIKTLVYDSMFGGNVVESTTGEIKPPGAIYNDFWGNSDNIQDTNNQFNSEFERVVNNTPITSGNLNKFVAAIEIDVAFMQGLGYIESVDVDVFIISKDRLEINIVVNQPTRSEPESFTFIWDETLKRVQLIQSGL